MAAKASLGLGASLTDRRFRNAAGEPCISRPPTRDPVCCSRAVAPASRPLATMPSLTRRAPGPCRGPWSQTPTGTEGTPSLGPLPCSRPLGKFGWRPSGLAVRSPPSFKTCRQALVEGTKGPDAKARGSPASPSWAPAAGECWPPPRWPCRARPTHPRPVLSPAPRVTSPACERDT